MDLTEKWKGFELNIEAALHPFVSIILTALIIICISIAYYIQNKNVRPTDKPKRFSMIIENLLLMVKQMVVESFGIKYVKWTPFFVFLLSFIALSNFIATIGFKEASISYTVPLTLGFTVWFISIVMGIKIQKWLYLKKFCLNLKIKGKEIPIMINPFSLIGLITPLISISFRLWGNILAGYIIYEVIFWALTSLGDIPSITVILVGGVILMPTLFLYFSFFTGAIQAYVFTLLSLNYISTPVNEMEEYLLEKQEKENQTLNVSKNKTKKY